MAARITVTGSVEVTPRVVSTVEGLHVASFRVRNAPDRGRSVRAPVRMPTPDGTGVLLVTAVGALALAVGAGVRSGDLVVVAGTLDLHTSSDGTVAAELHAEVIGLDIARRRSPSRAVDRDGDRAIPF